MKVPVNILKQNFESALKNAVSLGYPPPTDQGFDDQTFMALVRLASVYPALNQSMIQAAVNIFNNQLNGENARESLGRIMRLISETQHAGPRNA